MVATMPWLIITKYMCCKWQRIVLFVIITSRSFSHSRLITGCVPRVTRRMPHVEREQITLPEYLILPSVSCGVRVARSLVFCTVFGTILLVSFLLANVLIALLLLLLLLLLLRITASDYTCCIFIIFLLTNVLTVLLLRTTTSDYTCCIFILSSNYYEQFLNFEI